MKKTLVLILAAVLCVGAMAQTDGIVMNMAQDASGNWQLTVQLNNPSATAYSAFQIDLQASDGLTFDAATLTAGERAAALTMNTSTTASGLQRVVGYAPRTASTITGTSGTLFTITLNAPVALAAGNYDIIAKNVRFSRSNGAETLLPGMVSTFTVFDGDTFVLTWWNGDQIFRSVRLEAGATIPTIDTPAARAGYSFQGWGDVPALMPDSNVNVYAQWQALVYAVNYVVDGQTVRVDSVACGDSLSLFDYKPGDSIHYSFSGWTGEQMDVMPAHDLTYQGTLILVGDVNHDGFVNSTDVVAIYNYINEGEDSGVSLTDADINGDGAVNSSDVTSLYNLISTSAPVSSPEYRRALIRSWLEDK